MERWVERGEAHAPSLPRAALAWLAVYLLSGALAAACYGPAHGVYAVAAPAGRVVAVLALLGLVAALVTRRRAPTLPQAAALVPLVGLVAGVLAGAWARLDLAGARAAWQFAQVESGVSLAVSVAILVAVGASGRARV